LGLFIPSKYGPSLTYVISPRWSIELDYLKGALELPNIVGNIGSLSEQRIGLYARHYPGTNSFNLIYGLGYQTLRATLGDEMLSRLSGGNFSTDIRLLNFESLVFIFGLANRWQFKSGFTFGVDWIELNIPITQLKSESEILNYTTDSGDRENVEHVMSFARYIPTVVLLRVGAGWTF
jgi:hypothetical protein